MPKGEIYIQLVVGYAEDPKVRALARFKRDARALRDLYVQMLCYCKRTSSDGFVPAEEVGVMVYPDSPRIGERDVARLAEVGLVEAKDGGYWLPGYLKRNASRAQIQAKMAAQVETSADSGRFGNHQRWHVGRGVVEPECQFCPTPPDFPDPPDPDPDRDQIGSTRSGRDGNGSGSDRDRVAIGFGLDRIETEIEKPDRTTTGSKGHLSNARDVRDALAGPWHSPDAHRIVRQYADSFAERPPTSELNKLAVEITALLGDGIATRHVVAGLAKWSSKPYPPSSLPSFVAEVMRGGSTANTERRIATSDRKLAEAELLKDNPDPAVLALGGLTIADVPGGPHLRALPGGA